MQILQKNNKKAFTLLEVLISVTLFSIITLFLYQSLDMTQKSNSFYSSKLEIKQDENYLKKMFFLDFIHSDSNASVSFDSDNNSIISFKSSNTYHNPFYTHITYLVSKEQNLIRIESKLPFDKTKLNDQFFNSSFVDIVYSDVLKFKVINNEKINIFIEDKELNKILFSQ